MQLSSVVLPEPEGPMMATNSPRSTSKLTPSRARVVLPRLPPYTFWTSATRNAFVIVKAFLMSVVPDGTTS